MSILSVGQSALAAAQVGLVTTGHNIANASTPGYNRQVVMQGAVSGQDNGFGFVGKGTEVTGVRRVYSEFLGNQVMSTQTSKGQLDSYYSQIQQINNMLADSNSGLSPALQDFFSSVQSATADPGSAAARQSMLSSANALAGRFQNMDAQLGELRQGANAEIRSSVEGINVYAKQIGKLNDAIEKVMNNGGGAPNDLLDQRDQAVLELSKEIKVSVVKQGNTFNVMIGSGQPLVVGNRTYELSVAQSPTDANRAEVAYHINGKSIVLAEDSLSGGKLGGVMEFRAKTLDPTQNALGRVAITLASEFNRQHALGQDQNGASGGAFFNVGAPAVSPSSANSKKPDGSPAGGVDASFNPLNTKALTTSDYRVQVTGTNPAAYSVLRLSDNKPFNNSPTEVDGVQFQLTGTPAIDDTFVVRPTAAGASAKSGIKVALSDPAEIALGSPLRASAAAANTGTGAAGGVTATAAAANPVQPFTITFSNASTYSITDSSGNALASNQPFQAGADIAAGGWKLQIKGAPAAGDVFTVGANSGAAGDNSNALALAGLQSAQTTNGTASFQGAYSQLVNQVGNKTRELEVTSAAASQLYNSAVTAQQSESGVNLDEEAANLLKYQQAYQAAGKLMKTASDMFDVLLSLGA
ncbi:MAG: flagellar hook-associated protein FlgK [Noviherbaspirillum sp.]